MHVAGSELQVVGFELRGGALEVENSENELDLLGYWKIADKLIHRIRCVPTTRNSQHATRSLKHSEFIILLMSVLCPLSSILFRHRRRRPQIIKPGGEMVQ